MYDLRHYLSVLKKLCELLNAAEIETAKQCIEAEARAVELHLQTEDN